MAARTSAGRARRPATVVLLAALVVLLTAAVAGGHRFTPAADQPPTLGDEAVRTADARSLAAGLQLISWYPRDRAWEQQWTRFSPTVTAADLAVIHDLGATSVRVIVFPQVLGYPRPDAGAQRDLRATVDLADAAGLRVWLTLFDNFSSYTDLSGSRSWTTALLTPYADDRRIEAVEIRNEIKPADAGAMTWARDQIGLVHQLLPSTPVAVSLNGSVDPEAYATLLAALRPEAPDLVSYHYYGDPGLAYDHLERVITAAGTIPAVLGEAGYSTAALDGRCSERACREAEQVDWYQVVVAAARQAGLSTPAPWMAFDLTPDATRRSITPAGYGYGLFRTDGTAKPAAAVVTDSFADRWTTAPQDTDFQDTTTDGTRARAWVPWRPSGTFRVEAGAGVDGAAALAVSGTATLASGTSSWFTRPLQVVRPGQVWQVRVSARGAGATGRNALTLVWLDGAGHYLRLSTSAMLDPGTTGWQDLSVTATTPPGAAAVRISLTSAGNDGTVYYSHPGWSVTG